MVTIYVNHTVADYSAWKPYFDDHGSVRKQYGERGYQLYQDAENPNDLTMLFEWDTKENATKFLEESDLKEVMAEAGVVGEPEIRFLDGIEAKTPEKPPV